MKKAFHALLILYILLGVVQTGNTQCLNLTATNGDFENLSGNPSLPNVNALGTNNIPGATVNPFIPPATTADESVQNWYSPGQAVPITPDYFHTSNPGIFVGVPANFKGTENPHSGDGYGGMLMNLSESYQYKLDAPMVVGTEYLIVMWVSRGENSKYSIDQFEAGFSIGANEQIAGGSFVNAFTGIVSLNDGTFALTNTTGWTMICGTYVASGGEDHITIGNLGGVAVNTTTGPGTVLEAYYYIDDVMVLEDGGPVSLLCAGPIATCEIPGATYNWTPAAGLSCTNCYNPVATPTTTTTYTVTITLSGTSCSMSDQMTVMPPVTFGPLDDMCVTDDCILLDGSGSPTGGVFSGPGVSLVSGSYYFCPDVAGVGAHLLTYTDPSSCVATASIEVDPGQWPQTSSNAVGGDDGADIATDPSSNVYVTGTYTEQTEFGPYTITNNAPTEGMYLVKYDECGQLLWEVHTFDFTPFGNPTIATGAAVAVDNDNRFVYVTGIVQGDAEFTSTNGLNQQYTAVGVPNLYVAQYNLDGELQFVELFATYAANGWRLIPHSLDVGQALSTNGRVYVGGEVTNAGRGFLLGLDDVGLSFTMAPWSPIVTALSGNAAVLGVDVTSISRVYLTGYYNGSARIQSLPLGTMSATVSNPSALRDAFLFRFLDTGPLALFSMAETGGVNANRVAVGTEVVADNPGNPIVTGYYNGEMTNVFNTGINAPATTFTDTAGFVARATNMTSGSVWVQTIIGLPTGGSNCNAMHLDVKGQSVYVTGDYQADQVFIPASTILPLPAAGTNRSGVYVAQFNTDAGTANWMNSTDNDIANGAHFSGSIVASPISRYVYTTGDYIGDMDYFDNAGTFAPLVATGTPGARNAFVLRNSTSSATGEFRNSAADPSTPTVEAQKTWSIYPNPNNGTFNVSWESETPATIEVYDAIGHIVWSKEKVQQNTMNVDITSQPKGIYLVRITTENQTFTERVIRQ